MIFSIFRYFRRRIRQADIFIFADTFDAISTLPFRFSRHFHYATFRFIDCLFILPADSHIITPLLAIDSRQTCQILALLYGHDDDFRRQRTKRCQP
jgi:hypothetical protein